MSDLHTYICGIPCIVRINHWEPFIEGRYTGPYENSYPSEGGYGEYEILDRRGRRAEWLANKMSMSDEDKLQEEVFKFMERTGD